LFIVSKTRLAKLIGVVLVAGSILGATPPGAYAGVIEDLAPGEWYEVPNSHLRAVLPSVLPPAGNPRNIMAAWSGGAYDTKRDRLIVWGGGHADYGGNEIYTFDVSTLSWSRPWGPTPNIPHWRRPCTETEADGNPPSRHTYGGLVYLPNLDRLWAGGGSLWCATGGASLATWLFDFTTLTWERKADFPNTRDLEQVSAYDPLTGRVYFAHVSRSLFEYDPVGNTWKRLEHKHIGHDKTMALDPKRRTLVLVGGGQMLLYDLRPPGGWKTITPTGDTAILGARYPGFVYDPVSDRFVAWGGGSDVYVLDGGTMSWTKRTSTGPVVPSPATKTGTYGRWQYIPSRNVFIGVNSIDENVFIYRLTAGSGARRSGRGSTRTVSR
jgi:hypothetical protein